MHGFFIDIRLYHKVTWLDIFRKIQGWFQEGGFPGGRVFGRVADGDGLGYKQQL